VAIALPVVGACIASNTRSAFVHRRDSTSQSFSHRIMDSVEAYQKELGHLPVPDGAQVENGQAVLVTDQPAGIAFLRMLDGGNPQDAHFLILKDARSRKNGAIYDNDGKIGGLYDAAGNPFHIVIDTQGDGVLEAKRGDETETVRGKKCILFTAGWDRKLATWDDYRSWVGLPPLSRWSWQYVKSLLP
jgi:hypothetical protein